MAAVLSENALVRRSFLPVNKFTQICEKLSIDRERVPQMVFSGEEGANGQRVLGKYD